MEVTTKEIDGTQIICIEGKVDTNTSPELEKALMELIDQEKVNLLANFEKLLFISSAGLRVLLAAAKKTKAKSGHLKVCNLNETVKEVFDISGFSSILSVYGSEQEALKN